MGRRKKFKRADVLDKVALVFWENGFAGTTLKDLEKASGVNKSGLYSEFRNKEHLYFASLHRYIANLVASSPLWAAPLGYDNIERFFKRKPCGTRKGCFCINTMRELPALPFKVTEMVTRTMAELKLAFVRNIAAERPKMDPELIADFVLTHFIGSHLEQNLAGAEKSSARKLRNFMRILRSF